METKNRIVTAQTLTDIQLAQGVKFNSALYFDKPRDRPGDGQYGGVVTAENKRYNNMVVVAPGSSRWEQSEAYGKLWDEIEKKMNSLKQKLDTRKFNASQFPAEYYDLINMFRLDLTRRRVEAGDMSSTVAKEIVNPNISRTASVDEFLPFAGAFEEITDIPETTPLSSTFLDCFRRRFTQTQNIQKTQPDCIILYNTMSFTQVNIRVEYFYSMPFSILF